MRKVSFLISVVIPIFVSTCNTKQTITASQEIIIDTAIGSCPYLTKDTRNNIVLSWIKHSDTIKSVFCYAVSYDGGETFNKAIEIPGSTNVHAHGENIPKIIFKPSGEIIAIWGTPNPNPANAYSGLVYYTQSFDNGKTWTKAISLTKDTSSFDQRYFDVTLLPNGEAGIVWLDNRKRANKEGSGLYYAVTRSKDGFQGEKLIGEPCCQCCRTNLFIDRKENIHVVYRAIINDRIRDMVHIVSTPEGKSFSTPQRISLDNWVIGGCPHSGPAMTANKEGIHFTWFTGGSWPGIYYNNSKDNGNSFSNRDSVSGKASKHCQITTLPNDNILIVWNENFSNGNKFCSRIGIEERDENGRRITKQYITPGDSNSSFPVIYAINAKKAIVAYTEDIKGREYVLCKQVFIE
jgi:hypothetical protein